MSRKQPTLRPRNARAAYLMAFYAKLAGRGLNQITPGELEQCHAAARAAQEKFAAAKAK